MHKMDEAVLSLFTEIPAQMTTFHLYFALWNRRHHISWTFHIQILTNLHFTLCKNYLHYVDYLQMPIFSPELLKHCSRNWPSLDLTALHAILCITAPRADMSNYKNKQIPQKTGFASYLVSKSHGSEVGTSCDQQVFSSCHATIVTLPLNFSPQTTGKKTHWHLRVGVSD